MRKYIIVALLSLIAGPVFCQEMWTDHSATAKNKAFFGVGVDLVNVTGGVVFSIAPEYGRILNKYMSVGGSARLIWHAAGDASTILNFHPYLRLNTSFPSPLPNLFVDIGYDFRRVRYDDRSIQPSYYQDLGIRPGLDIHLSDKIHLFIMITFSGYQWSRVDGHESSSWKLFRHDTIDRLIGVYFYY